MRLGFVSAILPDLTFEETIQFASETGYDCLEVMCWPPGAADRRYAGVTHIDVTNFNQKEADRIKSLLKQYQVALSGLGYYPNPLSPDKTESKIAVEHIYRLIDAAVLLELSTVNTFIGRDWKMSVDENWPNFLDVWRPIISYAEKKRIRIGIENCPMLFGPDEWPGGKNLMTSPVIWDRMFSDIPSEYFGLNFDPSHFILQEMDIPSAIRNYGHKFFHIHAKDVRIDKEKLDRVGYFAFPKDYHTPKLPGLGDVNWQMFFSALTDCGYDGPVCVEVEDRAFEGSLEKRKQSLRQSLGYLRQFVPPFVETIKRDN